MKIQLASSSAHSGRAELLVLPVVAESSKKPSKRQPFAAFTQNSRAELEQLDSYCEGAIAAAIVSREYRPSKGAACTIAVPDAKTEGAVRTVRLVGLSEDAATSVEEESDEWRELGGTAYREARRSHFSHLAIALRQFGKSQSTAIVLPLAEGLLLATYQFDTYRGKAKNSRKRAKPSYHVTFHFKKSALPSTNVLRIARASSEAVCFARDLVNTPPSDMAPRHLAQHARRICTAKSPLRLQTHTKAALKRMGANAILAVSQGSATDPFLLHLRYSPQKKKRGQKRVVLVGKGVTFDSGGLSMKSPTGMIDMKADMAGAAAVLAVMHAIRSLPVSLRPAHEVHALIPTSENMVSEFSVKPGDVVQAMNGKTIEILNTDAEGRLLLADALVYSKKCKPDVIIDLATLTGSCVIALGEAYGGLFSNEHNLATLVVNSGRAAGERLWPLPLAEESYRSLLDSPVADLKNSAGVSPRATIAALFLQEFVPKRAQWAHLDIAGPAFVKRGNSYIQKGGTGFGVRTLLEFLRRL